MPDLETRIARLEAYEMLRQLPPRYARAVDSRNLDDLVALFVPDVNCGKRWGTGRDALKAYYKDILGKGFYRSQHFVCGHVIDTVTDTQATGTTYCQAFHEEGDGWFVMAICYFDEYARVDNKWLFVRRRELHWHSVDNTERPNDQNKLTRWPKDAPEKYREQLPQHWESWSTFWSEVDPATVRRLTKMPVN